MTKADRIDPMVHYSRQVRQLLVEKERAALALEYLAALVGPQRPDHMTTTQLMDEAYEWADHVLAEGKPK